jgi:hypothetical protein
MPIYWEEKDISLFAPPIEAELYTPFGLTAPPSILAGTTTSSVYTSRSTYDGTASSLQTTIGLGSATSTAQASSSKKSSVGMGVGIGLGGGIAIILIGVVVWVFISRRKKIEIEVVRSVSEYPEIDGKAVYRSELPEISSK